MRLEKLIKISASLPTGAKDDRALQKARNEFRELQAAYAAGDTLGAILEAGDVAYYCAKCLNNKLMTQSEADEYIERAASLANNLTSFTFTPEMAIRVAEIKMGLRARPGNPKDDAAERAAIQEYLGGRYG